jgi:hypothetical protein
MMQGVSEKRLLLLGVVVVVLGMIGQGWKHDRVDWQRRELPGFSIDLPRGDTEPSELDYAIGDVGGAVWVEWMPTMKRPVSELETYAIAIIPLRPAGTVVGPIEMDGRAYWIGMVACGGRRIIASTASKSTMMRAIDSIACVPDPVRERDLETPPLVIDLPDGSAAVDSEPCTVQLREPTSGLALEIILAGATDDLALTSMNALGSDVIVGSGDGEYTLTGTNGAAFDGFALPFACPRGHVLVIGTAPDWRAAETFAELVRAKSHCAGPGEVVRFPK